MLYKGATPHPLRGSSPRRGAFKRSLQLDLKVWFDFLGDLDGFLQDGIELAAENGPSLCVVAGPTPAIERMQETLAAAGIAALILSFWHKEFVAASLPLDRIILWIAVALALVALVDYALDAAKKLKAHKAGKAV